MKRLFLFFFILFFSSQAFALDPFLKVKVRVLSRYSLREVKITSSLAKLKIIQKEKAPQESLWPAQVPLMMRAKGTQIEIQIGHTLLMGDQAILTPPRGNYLTLAVGGELERRFAGLLTLRSVKGDLWIVEEIPLEEYVQGVLESEIPYGFPPEALKAQSVLIRTFALAHLDRHKKEGYNLCDLTHCQAYGGMAHAYRSYEDAVKATHSITLNHQFKPIEAMYHSTCGGHTSPFHQVFGGRPIPYLMGVSDDSYCARSPHYPWESSVSLKILEQVLRKDPSTDPKGEIRNLRPVDREENEGRVFTLALEGRRNFEVPVTRFLSVVGRYLGWSEIKSNWFEVEVKNEEAHFKGHGLGHGVGLCQWGARGMAEAGKKFDEILFHYFPGTHLVER